VHAALANAHACAARAKTAMGMAPAAWPALESGALRLNQAITQNPRFAPYTRSAGTVLSRWATSTTHGAACSTCSNLARQPMSLQMLTMLQKCARPADLRCRRGAQCAALDGARWAAPVAGGWQPQGCRPRKQQPAPDWMKPLAKLLDADKVFKTVGGFQDMVGKFE